MTGNVKKLLGGLVLGLMVIFAMIGIKSLLDKDEQPPEITTWQQPGTTGIVGLPGANGVPSSSQQDTAITPDSTKVELVNEEPEPPPVTPPAPRPVNKPIPTPSAPVATPPIATLPPVAPPVAVTPPVTEPPVATNEGTLEITLQTAENGIPLPADVYVQLPNGTNISKASSTPNAKFLLKKGTYRVTARADGRASVSRTISVPNQAVVNEIFALPLASNPPPAAPAAPVGLPPTNINPTPMQPSPMPPVSNVAAGKLRLVALDADNGSPIAVDFIINRLDGSTFEQINSVPVAEITLPAEEFVVRFNYQGTQGYKSLTVQPGQTHTHTFNIQRAPPEQPASPPPGSSLPELNMEELLKRMQQ
ncbi:hypothetical protein [Candidatus Thiothrix anitrata]|uniref:Carboxypeptidase regulatory-like domain-containing protein n=1 Tax=Candidatus Thiothrix anitrata TaxID=2823902 RepID=A0ABX7X5R1_9GAMM|nr:hypothetical protein [Candidatus Thiothrix anitrata]QTR50048.1 hypothetical protein J8380_00190 [Candidatus Thiothrix anitrata]